VAVADPSEEKGAVRSFVCDVDELVSANPKSSTLEVVKDWLVDARPSADTANTKANAVPCHRCNQAKRPCACERKDMDLSSAAALRVLTAEEEVMTVEQAVSSFLESRPKKASLLNKVVFKCIDSNRPVMFGGRFGDVVKAGDGKAGDGKTADGKVRGRAPLVFMEAPSEELAQYLLEDPKGPFASLSSAEGKGKWKEWDFTEDKKEDLNKADWHAVPHLPPSCSIFVPRRAVKAAVRRAPPRIVAFVHTFRAINQICWNTIIHGLQCLRRAHEIEDPKYPDSFAGQALVSIIDVLRNSRHFGIVEAQVRWGDKARKMPSHKDGATSLLHLSLTLGGKRTVRSGTFSSWNAESNTWRGPKKDAPKSEEDLEKNVWDDELWRGRIRDIEMTPGCVYISSPFLFEHAVEYLPCPERDPVIALQCRFAFPDAIGKALNEERTEAMREIATVFAEALSRTAELGLLRMPTVADVKKGEVNLQKMDDEKEEKRKKEAAEAKRHLMANGAGRKFSHW